MPRENNRSDRIFCQGNSVHVVPGSESRKAWEHAGGPDSFTSVVHTAGGDTNVATVRITVRPRTVIARDDSFTMVQGTTLSVAAPGVLANDSYPAGSSVEFDTVSGLEKRRRYRGLQLHAGPVVHGHGVVLVHDSPAWRKQPAGYCRHRCA